MPKFVGRWPKTYSCLTDDGNNYKKAKGAWKCVIKLTLTFKDYQNCPQNNQNYIKSI